MKKTTTFFAFLFFLSFVTPARASEGIEVRNSSDNTVPFILKKGKKGNDGYKGKRIFTLGVGLNTTAAVTVVRYAGSNDTIHFGGVQSYSTFSPFYNLMFDYGIADRFTVGIGLGYQKFNIVWGDPALTFTDTWTRIAIAARADYRIIAKEKLGLYTGLRVGYNLYTLTSTFTKVDKNYVANNNIHPTAVAVQAHMGFSYYFDGHVGVNVELGLAIGGPYYSAVGITYKL